MNINDSKHFKRNIESKLEKWGYDFVYERSYVIITRQPELPEEKLAEILIRKLGLDIQVDAYAFACFICAFADIRCFDSMPWEERAELLKYEYDVEVSDRTLRSWCSKLIEKNIVQKSAERTYWKTDMHGGVKCRAKVSADDIDMATYFQARSKHLEAAKESAAELQLTGKEASAHAWRSTYSKLWEVFKCCYYSCGSFVFNAATEDYVFEIHELAHEIAAKEELPVPERIEPTTKEEFYAQWHNL